MKIIDEREEICTERDEREFARFAQILVVIAAGIYIGHNLIADFWEAVTSGLVGIIAVNLLAVVYDWILRRDAKDKAAPK